MQIIKQWVWLSNAIVIMLNYDASCVRKVNKLSLEIVKLGYNTVDHWKTFVTDFLHCIAQEYGIHYKGFSQSFPFIYWKPILINM